jgi:FAD binding domain
MNLGWKLGATIRGSVGPDLLSSYEAERQPNARRNTAYARQFADSLGMFVPVPEIEYEKTELKHAVWPAAISKRTARPSSISPESPSARDTTPRRSRFQTERSRRPMRPICMFPAPAPAAAHLTCGCPRSNPSTTSSALNGRCCGFRTVPTGDGLQR